MVKLNSVLLAGIKSRASLSSAFPDCIFPTNPNAESFCIAMDNGILFPVLAEDGAALSARAIPPLDNIRIVGKLACTSSGIPYVLALHVETMF